MEFEPVDITALIPKLTIGENVLAIQGMNTSRAGSDFLIVPKLSYGTRASNGISQNAIRYTAPVTAWILTEGILLACFSTTLGKWILNIKTLKLNGKKIDPLTALIRSFYVFVFGFGLCFFPFIIICPVISYFSLMRKKSTQWDRWLKLQITHNELTGMRILSGIFVLFIITNLIGFLLLPPEQIKQINQ